MRPKSTEILLFVLLLGTFAYFNRTEPGWNVNSRIALTYAIFEHGTVCIDGYYDGPDFGTQDAARYNDRTYSDKAIGTSLLGLPALALVRGISHLSGTKLSVPWERYWITTLSVGLIAAATSVVFLRLLLVLQRRRSGEESSGAPLLITLLLFAASPLLYYSSLFMAYLPALFFALLAVYVFENHSHNSPLSKSSATPPFFLAGLLMGVSVLCENLMGMLAVAFWIYALTVSTNRRNAWKYVIGGFLGVLPFIIYCYAIFGRLAIPYQYHLNPIFAQSMARGLLGATVPDFAALVLLTVHPYRGIFVHCPFLVPGLIGLIWFCRNSEMRPWALLSLSVFFAYLLFNSAYYMWWGGWSFAPRHLIPMLPFLATGLLAITHRSSGRLAILLLGLPALALHLLVNSVDPQIRDLLGGMKLRMLMIPDLRFDYEWTLPEIWRRFTVGETDVNLGSIFGLSGPLSLLPLILFWIAMLALMRHSLAGQNAPKSV
ncbi:MAG: hypothetical protein K1X53_05615 [Candidatus Sumerlaeaceae bacterium]|nr:hypothetical protein [Candidatus Sumerlaeaceae bacterium]